MSSRKTCFRRIMTKHDVNSDQKIKGLYDQLRENVIHAQKIAQTSSWTYDIQKDEYFYTNEIYNILDCRFHEFDGKLESFLNFVHPDYLEVFDQVIECIKAGKGFDTEYKIITKSGDEKYIHERAKILFENDKPIKLIGVIEDVTATRLYHDNLKEIGDHLNYAQKISGVGSFKYDALKNEVIASAEALRIYDEANNNDTIESYIQLIHPEDQAKVKAATDDCLLGKSYSSIKFRIPQKDATNKYILSKADPLYDEKNQIVGIIGSIQDITKNELLRQELEREHERLIVAESAAQQANKRLTLLAHYDELTGLPNRNYFKERLTSVYKSAQENNTRFALIMLDVDRIKYINYSLGYDVGEKVIVEVVSKLKLFLTEDMFLSRYSDDHFAIIIQGKKTRKEYDDIAKGIISIFKSSFKVGNFVINLSTNIGIYVYNKENSSESFSIYAKLALMRAKKEGQNTYEFFYPELDIQNYKEISLRCDINNAIENDQLRVYYQPIIDLRTNVILAAEALIRWEHPDWGLVYPSDFIRLAEETDRIIDVSNWLLREVFKTIKKWQDLKMPKIKICVNISPIQFMEKNFIRNFRHMIEEFDVDPRFLIIEIKENTLVDNSEMVISLLNKLKSMGIQVALDDYGTSYSSLSYLTYFNFDILKIVGSFIKDISNETKKIAVKNIINLANDLGMKVVAEGIEEWDQLTNLKEYKCYAGQGYIFSRPVPIFDFEEILKKKMCEPRLDNKAAPLVNRRKYFRVEFSQYLEAYLTIKEIEGRPIDIGNTNVLVKNIGPGGLCFIANIRLPIDKDFLTHFRTQILGEDIKVNAKLIWEEELRDNLHKYGVEFIMDEDERTNLIRILNEVQIRMKSDILFEDVNFTKLTPVAYFNNEQ